MKTTGWIALLLLGACSPVHLQPICPTLVSYSRSDQAALVTELQAHPDLKEIPRWISDYVGLRNQVWTCRNGKSP